MKDDKQLLNEMAKRPLSFRESAMLASNIRSVEYSKKLQEDEIRRWADGCPTLADRIFRAFEVGLLLFAGGMVVAAFVSALFS